MLVDKIGELHWATFTGSGECTAATILNRQLNSLVTIALSPAVPLSASKAGPAHWEQRAEAAAAWPAGFDRVEIERTAESLYQSYGSRHRARIRPVVWTK